MDGTLTDKDMGLELSYLFWEAAAHHTAPPSPPLSPAASHTLPLPLASAHAHDHAHDHEYFDPVSPLLDPSSPTAVLLPFAALLPYLDGVLKQHALHTAARNDFITYWLPALSKQPYVALRFLPQAVYERAAELRVEPRPDVVTRAMMLFVAVRVVRVYNMLVGGRRSRHYQPLALRQIERCCNPARIVIGWQV